ncbi:hypothetical protein ACPV5Q_10135 [Vibrio astriarenae]
MFFRHFSLNSEFERVCLFCLSADVDCENWTELETNRPMLECRCADCGVVESQPLSGVSNDAF